MQLQFLLSICLATASLALPALQNAESRIEARLYDVSLRLICLILRRYGLIVTNCLFLGVIRGFVMKQTLLHALRDIYAATKPVAVLIRERLTNSNP